MLMGFFKRVFCYLALAGVAKGGLEGGWVRVGGLGKGWGGAGEGLERVGEGLERAGRSLDQGFKMSAEIGPGCFVAS